MYEDLIESYDDTVRGVLEFLDIPDASSVPVPAPSFERLADDVTEQWCERYRAGS